MDGDQQIQGPWRMLWWRRTLIALFDASRKRGLRAQPYQNSRPKTLKYLLKLVVWHLKVAVQ